MYNKYLKETDGVRPAFKYEYYTGERISEDLFTKIPVKHFLIKLAFFLIALRVLRGMI